jgi:Predicted periplasmic solute-binding protein
MRIWDTLPGSPSTAIRRWQFLKPQFPANEGAFLAETYVWNASLVSDALGDSAHLALIEALMAAWAQTTAGGPSCVIRPYGLLILPGIIEKEGGLR